MSDENASADGRPRRRRRRRRGGEGRPDGDAHTADEAVVEGAERSAEPSERPERAAERSDRPVRTDRGGRGDRGARPDRGERSDRSTGSSRQVDSGRSGPPPSSGGRGAPADRRTPTPTSVPSARTQPRAPTPTSAPIRSPSPTLLAARERAVTSDDDIETEARVAWGVDDDGAATDVVLAPDLPVELDDSADAGGIGADGGAADTSALASYDRDLDPRTDAGDGVALLGTDVFNVVGVRFVPAGRVYLYDAVEATYQRGERVVVEAERGTRLGVVAVDSVRRPYKDRDRQLRRVLRRPNAGDLRADDAALGRAQQLLRLAKDKARALRLPIKVFRIEPGHGRILLYFTSDERVDLRDLLRELGPTAGARIELRQLGVRDEAKVVGGIGSCGQELCCTTWLPEFVPVSIKMAKDQGLVLNPTKVSGQCGRLKCCLVYEQATYAELRKGLPKLGKRVITAQGEGRVVEVDVLRQRVRVAYGPGELAVLDAADVRPMFAPQGRAASDSDHSGSHDAPEPSEVSYAPDLIEPDLSEPTDLSDQGDDSADPDLA